MELGRTYNPRWELSLQLSCVFRSWLFKENMKAMLYTRVSTTRQAEQGQSLGNQEARLRHYASFRGFTDVELIADEGLSGKTIERPGFQRMMESIRNKSIDAVIVYSLSRFARNTIATLEAVSQMTQNGITFHSLTEQLDTSSPIGRFFLATLAALAELEREQIVERTRSILEFRKMNGLRVGGIPFGKREVAKGRLVNDEEEQKAIRLMCLLKKEMSYSAIARELKNRNILNKAGRATWTKSQVWRIVKSSKRD